MYNPKYINIMNCDSSYTFKRNKRKRIFKITISVTLMIFISFLIYTFK